MSNLLDIFNANRFLTDYNLVLIRYPGVIVTVKGALMYARLPRMRRQKSNVVVWR
jgi:hypothetical protein